MIYDVIPKAGGPAIYRYEAADRVEWSGMEFATHDHVEVVETPNAPAPVPKILTPLQYLRRFSLPERVAIREAAKTDFVVEDLMDMLDRAQEINTADMDTIAGTHYLEHLGLIAAGRAVEVLHG